MQNNVSYDEYIRSILGYPPMNSMNNTYQSYGEENMDFGSRTNSELEGCYPEIYKIVYPMVATKCNNFRGNVTNDDIESMTDEIYYALEEKNEIQLNINLSNDVRTSNLNSTNSTKASDRKPEVRVSQSSEGKREVRETRQINRGLRDLIKILLIRELLNRPGRPHNPRPPMPGPGPGGPRPPMRPPFRPPFGPGPGGPVRPPFNREFESLNYDIFEN